MREYTRSHRNKLAVISQHQEEGTNEVIVPDVNEQGNIKDISAEANTLKFQDQRQQDVHGYDNKEHGGNDDRYTDNTGPVMENSNYDGDHIITSDFREALLSTLDPSHNSRIDVGKDSDGKDTIVNNRDITENEGSGHLNEDLTPANINFDGMQTPAEYALKNDNQENDASTMHNSHSMLPSLSKLVVKNSEDGHNTKWEPAKK